MPLIGLGTFLSKDEKIMTDLVRAALEVGYRHLDTAFAYDNHEILGKALSTIFKEGKYKREDIFITTKIFPYKHFNSIEKLK